MSATVRDLLLGSPTKAKAAAMHTDATGSWAAVIATCDAWRVLPHLNRRVTEAGVTMPRDVRQAFRGLTAKAFLRTSRCLERGAAALARLNGSGIRCAGFKGVAAVGLLHGGPGDRTLQDVDILIDERDLARSLVVLSEIGFVPVLSGSLQDYVAFVRNCPGFAGNQAVVLADGRGGSIDLHWRLGRLDTRRLLAEVETVNVFGNGVPVVRAAHCITVAAHHSIRNDFVPDDIVRDLIDFREWLPLIERRGEARLAAAFAKENQLLGPALALAHLVESYGERPSPPSLAEGAVAGELEVMADLVELYRIQSHEGVINTDLVYLASARSLRQILAGVGSGWRRYRAHMKALEQTNGRLAIPLGPRLRRIAADAWRLPVRRWRLVRALAAAKSAATD